MQLIIRMIEALTGRKVNLTQGQVRSTGLYLNQDGSAGTL
jgi:hypothetical protein